MEWYLQCIQNFANFSGRARRKEYWWFTLINTFIVLVLYAVYLIVFFNFPPSSGGSILVVLARIVIALFILAIIVPTISVTVRRMHDIGRSGWFALIVFLPSIYRSISRFFGITSFLIGILMLGCFIIGLVLCLTDSQVCKNQWGPNPKASTTNIR